VEVYQPDGRAVEYRLVTSDPSRELAAGADLEATLPLGDSHYWSVQGQAGEPLRLEVESAQFDAALALHDPSGQPNESEDDTRFGPPSRNPILVTPLTATGRYLVRVHAVGDGGSGAYRIRRVRLPDRLLAPGPRVRGAMDAGGRDVWTVEGRAGQVVLVHLQSDALAMTAMAFGPDGKVLNLDMLVPRTNEGGAAPLRLPTTGRYRLWVHSLDGTGPYWIRLYEAN